MDEFPLGSISGMYEARYTHSRIEINNIIIIILYNNERDQIGCELTSFHEN